MDPEALRRIVAHNRLRRAVIALLRECDARWYSSHPMAYVIPWGKATELQRAVNALTATPPAPEEQK